MARRFRKAYRRIGRAFRKGRRSHRGTGGLNTTDLITVAVYGGFARPYIANAAAPVINKIPAGQYSDNVALGGGAYLLGKFMPSMKKYTKGIILSEVFIAASKAGSGMSGSGSSSSTGKVLG